MIYCTVGIPSRFSEWCETLLVELVAAASSEPVLFAAEALEQLGRELLAHDGRQTIVVSRQPQLALTKALMTRPIVVILDEPQSAVGSLICDHGRSHAEAVRVVANAMTALLPLISAPDALVLKSETPGAMEAIAKHFAIVPREDVAARIREQHPPRDPSPMPAIPPLPPPASATAATVRDAIGTVALESALTPLWTHLNGSALDEIVWSPQLFFLAQDPVTPPTEPIDVTGAARCLFYGPYIRLPEGPWSCSMIFGCSKSGARLAVEVVAGVLLNRVNFELSEAGVFEIELSFVNSNPDTPVEVRLFTAEAAFEGEFVLGQIRMKPLKARRLA